MSLRMVTPSATLAVSVAEAKANGRIDYNTDDALIETLIRAATAYAERACGIAFEAQTWELTLDGFPAAEIELGRGPLVSVTSVKYDDVDGAEQTVDPDAYAVDAASPDGWVVPVGAWPATMATINAVRVRFIIGRGTPHDVKQAILLLVEHYNTNRAEASEAALATIPFGAAAILNLHRRMFA